MRTLLLVIAGAAFAACSDSSPIRQSTAPEPAAEEGQPVMGDELPKTEEEWKQRLTPEQYEIIRMKGTERPGTGAYLHNKEAGVYECVGCGLPLFKSDAKYESGCGWPSFFEPLEGANITEHKDTTHGMIRTEVTCSRCGAHLGHVFNDGPQPTGLRYCINSVSLDFEKKDEKPKETKKDE